MAATDDPRRGRGRPPIAVLHGAIAPDAPPDELDTLEQARAVSAALERLGHAATPLALTLDLEGARRRLARLRPRLVFNLVEAIKGSGRLIHLAPALLDEMGLPYTGASQATLFLTSHKPLAKRLLDAGGVPIPAAWEEEAEGGPWIVKSVWEHASLGLDDDAVLDDPAAVAGALARQRARHGGEWFAERYIEGREFNLALIEEPEGPRVLPPAEIRFTGFPPGKPRIVGYAGKWLPESAEYRGTVRSFDFPPADAPLLAELAALARRCWELCGLRGYARVDFRVDGAGQPWVLEVNANPCLSPDAGFAAAAAEGGMTFDAVIGRIVEAALRDAPSASPSKEHTAPHQARSHSR